MIRHLVLFDTDDPTMIARVITREGICDEHMRSVIVQHVCKAHPEPIVIMRRMTYAEELAAEGVTDATD